MKNETTHKGLERKLNQALERLEWLEGGRRPPAASDKNEMPGGYYMMSRSAEKVLRNLQRENSAAALVFSVIREHMQIGTNAVTISQTALCKILGLGRSTIYRASKYLSDNRYVQLIKIGTSNAYVVNERIAFSGRAGQRKAVFSATVVAHECEQEEGWDEVKKLKHVPVLCEDSHPLAS